MSTRWLGTQRGSEHADPRPGERQRAADASRPSTFSRAEGFWRSWLATGARRVPIDRRRARGAETYLKKILVGGPSGAVDFSSAMARQAVDEALHELPPQHKQVVKLAYFGGLTNREVAQELGLTVGEVRRLLRASLATVGSHFERGRAKGRRAIQDLVMLPWSRVGEGAQRVQWPALDQVLQTGFVAVMTGAAVALLVAHQTPVHAGHPHRPPHVSAVGSAGSELPAHAATVATPFLPPAGAAPLADWAAASGPLADVALDGAPLPSLPASVSVPAVLPSLRVQGPPQLPFGE
jgi:DNA-directed RNA polymerase specialized sigma24 family protein